MPFESSLAVDKEYFGENSQEFLLDRIGTPTDEFQRNVFGLLGVPVDAIRFEQLLLTLRSAVKADSHFLLSTPNINFLIKSQKNSTFRESMLQSDLCLVDGMPLIWIAKLLGIPIRERIAGSDLFERLKADATPPLNAFLLGGADGVAEIVGSKLNAKFCGIRCVGVLNPGFGTVAELSRPEIIDQINDSKPDLLAVFFAAEKAQEWLLHNHFRIRAPIQAQFGATINFEAGTVRRAPSLLRSTGFEWLWRIKEEPYLWRRYWADGLALLRLLLTNVVPLMFHLALRKGDKGLQIFENRNHESLTLALSGDANGRNIEAATRPFRIAANSDKSVTIDMSQTTDIDARFFGLLLVLRKQLLRRGGALVFTGISPKLRRIFRLNRFEFLLSD